MSQILSIKHVRQNLAEVVNKVEHGGEEIVITKHGKPCAMIIPVSGDKIVDLGNFDGVFGVWKDREDIHDSGKWVKDVKTIGSLRRK